MKLSSDVKYYCDICTKEILNKDQSNVFYYKKGWQSGSHGGTHDKEGHICSKCDKSSFRRYIANLYVKTRG